MQFDIALDSTCRVYGVKVGNCYAVRGGYGAKKGHIMVVVAINERTTLLVIDREGQIVGGTTYCNSYLEDKCPIGYVEGLEDINLTMRSL